MAADMKKSIASFAEVLRFPLAAIFEMHHVPGAIHCFMRMNAYSYFSVVQMDGVDQIPVTLGVTHAGAGETTSARGTLQHMAFRVDTEEDLLFMRDRIRGQGINVIGPVDHGFCKSIYFAGPDHTALEVSWAIKPIDPKMWVDPNMLAKIGITPEEGARYCNPPPYAGPRDVPQPPYDPEKPHLNYPDKLYRKILAKTDEAIGRSGEWSKPPVDVAQA